MEHEPHTGDHAAFDPLYKVDNYGRAHNHKGWFMSRSMVEQIEAHRDQITEGLGGYGSVREKYEAEQARGPVFTSKILAASSVEASPDRAVAAEEKRPMLTINQKIILPPKREKFLDRFKRSSKKAYLGFIAAAKEVWYSEQNALKAAKASQPHHRPKEVERPGIVVVWWEDYKFRKKLFHEQNPRRGSVALLIGGAAVLAAAATGAWLTTGDTDKGPSDKPSVSTPETPDIGNDGTPNVPQQPSPRIKTAHVLESGESIWAISEDLARSVGGAAAAQNVYIVDAIKDRIIQLNNFPNPDELAVGTTVKGPSKNFVRGAINQYS